MNAEETLQLIQERMERERMDERERWEAEARRDEAEQRELIRRLGCRPGDAA